jgi:hypothetical protein
MWLNGMAESRRHQGRFDRMLKCSRSVANPTQVLPCVITENVAFWPSVPAALGEVAGISAFGDNWDSRKPEGEASPAVQLPFVPAQAGIQLKTGSRFRGDERLGKRAEARHAPSPSPLIF